MHCLRCRATVPADARFCPSCGTPQWRSCTHCGASNQPGDRFCKGCGKAQADHAVSGGPEPDAAREAERRNLTVMFCDLVGSVALSTELDAEDLRDLIRAYQQTCASAIERYDGHTAQYLGDGVLAYFGYPVAHEDDARRAVHAALETVDTLAPLAARWRREAGVTLRVRIGVHSGQAVVGEMGSAGHSQMLATGETPNIAARIQGLAEPNTIVISEATQTLVRGYFRLDPLMRRAVEGIGQPLSLFRVIGRTGASTRLAAVGDDSLLPFVGRGTLVDELQQRWTTAFGGQGHAVMLQGEPGMGKSRVLRALRERLALAPAAVVELQCSPYQQSSAFAPLIETIERSFGLVREHSAAERGAALAAALAVVPSTNPAETLTLLSDLLSAERPGGHADLQMTPQAQRRRTIELLTDLLLQRAARQPLLLVVEDMHWADPSTLDVIDEIVQHAPQAGLLVVMTHRPESVPAWARAAGVTQVTLGALEGEAAAAIVQNVNGGRTMPAGLLQLVLARAEGNPLYLEEITRVVLDAGVMHDEPLQAERAIPATVQESLAARIDRLGPAKPIAQLAAALGRQFSYELLRVMADMVPTGLEHALEQLVSENLLVQQGTPPQADYSFKHALLRDAAYQSLLRSRRREIHATIARTLVERFPQTCEAQPEVPARHYTEAGDSAEAIALWRKAGERAMARSAQAEAAAHFAQALLLVRKLPAGPERTQGELGLLMTLGPLQMATRGYADPSVAQTYREAREICNALGEVPQLVPVLFGLWAYHVVGGDLRIALYLGDQILRQLQDAGDDGGLLLEAQVVRGVTQYFRGDFEDAAQTLRAGIAIYDPAQHRAHAQVFGQEPGMALHVYLAKALAARGDGGGAAEHAREAARIAEETGHFHTSGFCMTYEMVVHVMAGDAAAVAPLAARCAALAREQCFPIWEAASQLLGGWAEVQQGDSAVGLSRMREGLSRWRATGTTLYAPYWSGLLAEALAAQGQIDEASVLIDAAVNEEEGGEERVSLAELWRLRAALALQRHGRAAEATARGDLAQSMALARAQGAGLWLRRAEATLAALEAALQPG